MKKFLALFIILIALMKLSQILRRVRANVPENFFKLALQWPTSVVENPVNGSNQIQKLHRHLDEYGYMFTIHGLWAEVGNVKARYPYQLHPKELINGIDELKKYWPSFSRFSDEQFWQYEWEKHGKCVVNLNPTKFTSPTAYFRFSVHKARKFHEQVFRNLLNTYRPTDGILIDSKAFKSKLEEFHEKKVSITTIGDKLMHIYICFDTNGDSIDCKFHSHRETFQWPT